MGQDTEQAAEFVATVRGEHVAMKTWYNQGASEASRALFAKYGPYPGLWKEVLNWPGWKEARKEYLKEQQQSQSSQQQQPSESSSGDGAPPAIPRKRKSRWGDTSGDHDNNNNSNNISNNNGDANAARRRSRWGSSSAGGEESGVPAPGMTGTAPLPPVIAAPLPMAASVLPTINTASAGSAAPPLVLPGMTMPLNLSPQKQEEMRQLQARLRGINDKLDHLDQEAARVDALPRGHPERSPSPPPIYGPDGKRKNTRAVRWRERYTSERQDVLERIMNLNPNPYARKTMSHLLVRKRLKKIPIPIEKHPNYNFIGLIIGPRGKTQKELEAKTGCKIAIRGKGSVKEGARGRRDGKVMEGDNEPLHVVISGDDQKAVDAAADMIEQMLVVIDDEKNVHKQQQLRELALLNGTLKEDEYCQICAEKGHRSFECPRRLARNNQRPLVKCAICGETSHPTRDCTQKNNLPTDPTSQKKQQEIDSDYLSFMAELDGKKTVGVEQSSAAVPNGANPAAAPPVGGLPPPPPPMAGGVPPLLPPPPVGGLAAAPPPPPLPHHPSSTAAPSLLPPPPPPPSSSVGVRNNNGGGLPPGATGYYGAPSHGAAQPYGNAPYGNAVATPGVAYNYGATNMAYGAQPLTPAQQQQQQQAAAAYAQPVRPGEETTGWDPSSYYGYSAQSGGAGGFNWWEK